MNDQIIGINVRITHKMNERITATTFTCKVAEICPLFKMKKCANVARWDMATCPNGEVHAIDGPTRRAKSYSTFKQRQQDRKEHHDINYVLQPPKMVDRQLMVMGAYVWLPFAHLGIRANDQGVFRVDAPFSSGRERKFVPVAQFTPEFALKLINNKPPWSYKAPLRDFKNIVQPLLIFGISTQLPSLINGLCDLDPSFTDRLKRAIELIAARHAVSEFSGNEFVDVTWQPVDAITHVVLIGQLHTIGNTFTYVSEQFGRKAKVTLTLQPTDKVTLLHARDVSKLRPTK